MMKSTKLLRLTSLALLMSALSFAHATLGAQQDGDPAPPMAHQQEQQQPDSTNQRLTGAMGSLPDVKTFGGKITKSGSELVLEDSTGESTYQLDDQTKAEAFVGKNVKVTGTVDELTRTVHVARIEPES
jgi:hypothetical protein